MRVIHVNKSDIRGGAGRFAMALHHGLQKQSITSHFLVEHKYSHDEEVIKLENDRYRSTWFKTFNALSEVFRTKKFIGSWPLFKMFRAISRPINEVCHFLGRDYFNYPGLRAKLSQLGEPAGSILQVYVTHGNYLDLRYLQQVSNERVVVLRMPDAWLLSGHCAHSFDCDRWKTGCGSCPDLTIPPKIERDATAHNWKVKANLYKKSRFHIVTPSHWLMSKVKDSSLVHGAASLNVIPNGVDVDIFSPGDRQESREKLGINPKATVLLFSANGIKKNRWKDFGLLRTVLTQLAESKFEKPIEFIGLGDSAEDEIIGNIRVRYVKYQQSSATLTHYYRAADVYLHPTKADSFPNSTLEALACGIPVIASCVGGIPEQIKSLSGTYYTATPGEWKGHEPEDATGILIHSGDESGFAQGVKFLIDKEDVRHVLGKNARADAAARFSQERVTTEYLKLYQQLLSQ